MLKELYMYTTSPVVKFYLTTACERHQVSLISLDEDNIESISRMPYVRLACDAKLLHTINNFSGEIVGIITEGESSADYMDLADSFITLDDRLSSSLFSSRAVKKVVRTKGRRSAAGIYSELNLLLKETGTLFQNEDSRLDFDKDLYVVSGVWIHFTPTEKIALLHRVLGQSDRRDCNYLYKLSNKITKPLMEGVYKCLKVRM